MTLWSRHQREVTWQYQTILRKRLSRHRFIFAFETIAFWNSNLISWFFSLTFRWLRDYSKLSIGCSSYSPVSTLYILHVWWGFWLFKTQYLPTSFTRLGLLRGRDLKRCWNFQNFFFICFHIWRHILPWCRLEQF